MANYWIISNLFFFSFWALLAHSATIFMQEGTTHEWTQEESWANANILLINETKFYWMYEKKIMHKP